MPHIDATGFWPWPDEPATSDMTRLTVDHHPDDMIRFIEVNGMSTLDEMGPETLPDDVRQTTRPNAMVPNAHSHRTLSRWQGFSDVMDGLHIHRAERSMTEDSFDACGQERTMGSLFREIPHAEEPARALDPLNLLVWPKCERFSVREVRMPSTEEEDAVHMDHTGHGAKKLRWEWLWPPRIDHVHGLQPEGPRGQRARSSS